MKKMEKKEIIDTLVKSVKDKIEKYSEENFFVKSTSYNDYDNHTEIKINCVEESLKTIVLVKFSVSKYDSKIMFVEHNWFYIADFDNQIIEYAKDNKLSKRDKIFLDFIDLELN